MDLAILEAPPNPRIGVGVEATKMITINGMPPNPLALVEGVQSTVSLKGHGGMITIVVLAITPPKKAPRTGTIRISPHTTQKNMMIEKGLEAPAQETTDIEGREALTDTIPEEGTMMKAEKPIGIMGPAQAVETTAQAEENMIKTDMAEETRAQDIDLAPDPDIQEKNLQMKAGDTLVTIGDGDAKGP